MLALLGENGAGKSTLVSILFGHYVARRRDDRGLSAARCRRQPKAAALAAGIGMVHQHFTLADNLSVLDNVMLGHRAVVAAVLAPRRALPLLETGARFGLGVGPGRARRGSRWASASASRS